MKTIQELRDNNKIHILAHGDDGGQAIVKHSNPKGKPITVVFSWGGGWGHVSASYPNRCLTWEEMCYIKDLFFNDEDCVVQYHPPKSEYVNLHPYCLHLWEQLDCAMPRPPKWMVGF